MHSLCTCVRRARLFVEYLLRLVTNDNDNEVELLLLLLPLLLKLGSGDMAHPGRLLVVVTTMLVVGPGHLVSGVQDLLSELKNHVG